MKGIVDYNGGSFAEDIVNEGIDTVDADIVGMGMHEGKVGCKKETEREGERENGGRERARQKED